MVSRLVVSRRALWRPREASHLRAWRRTRSPWGSLCPESPARHPHSSLMNMLQVRLSPQAWLVHSERPYQVRLLRPTTFTCLAPTQSSRDQRVTGTVLTSVCSGHRCRRVGEAWQAPPDNGGCWNALSPGCGAPRGRALEAPGNTYLILQVELSHGPGGKRGEGCAGSDLRPPTAPWTWRGPSQTFLTSDTLENCPGPPGATAGAAGSEGEAGGPKC